MTMQDMLAAHAEAEARSAGARYRARAFGAALMLFSLLGMGFCLSQSVKAAGYVADKGTVTVSECRTERSLSRRVKKEETRCTGVFRSEGGRTVRDDAELTGYYVPGEKVRVYREASDYSLVSLRAFWGWLCLVFFCLVLFSRGLVSVVVGVSATAFHEFPYAQEMLKRTPFADYVKWLLLIGGCGLLLCVMLAAVSP
ncbi:hypothetical protein M1P56_07200 [Streptomyces sp. HU2014]|uniref:Uncharacterized protein n=1 Tax=Streptomyces albireticuli TaxID=1940 RepID=A0A1Z2L8N4_9ACTN|nr:MULTISPECIES: hypothetical protein [Streptomyces]ARZ70656.1 hypothetical protein SMD11_5064 [Streptomyces albireticuli]UQI44153.1 hypothetical protein M1P56_07200 [Streptomyces sp. HU2014]